MISIRELAPADLDAVFRVRVATWHNPHGAAELARLGITPESVAARMCSSHRGWVAVDADRIVGFSMGDRTNGEMWVIAVLPEFEGRGVGRRLLTEVEHWLRAEGWREIWLTTDPDESVRAVGFYRHLGWKDWKFEGGDRYLRKRFDPGDFASLDSQDQPR